MKKRIITAGAVLFCLWLFILPVYAGEETTSPAGEIIEELVPDEITKLLKERGLPPIGELISMTPGDFSSLVLESIGDALYSVRGAMLSLMAICLLCGLLESLTSATDEALSGVMQVVAVLCVSATVTARIVGTISRVGVSIQECTLFMLSFTPVLALLISAYGLPATATLYNLMVLGACQVISQIAASNLVPVMGVYVALCVSAGVSGNKGLWSLAGSIKKLGSWALGLMMTMFTGFLTLGGFMSSGADSMSIRATKFLVGNMVPVVGSALVDALMAAQGSIRIIKNAVGVAGVVAALIIFLPVLAEALLWRMALTLTSACSDLLGVSVLSKLLAAFSDVMALLVAVIISVALLMIISTAAMLAMQAG